MNLCTICNCKNPEEPANYPCKCYNISLCSTCFKNLFQTIDGDDYYKKIMEEDGSIRFQKVPMFHLENNFYCRHCFTKWDFQLSKHNYLLEKLNCSVKEGAYEFLFKHFVFALCKLQKFMDYHPDYDLEKRMFDHYDHEEDDEEDKDDKPVGNHICKDKWHYLTYTWMNTNPIVHDLLLTILYSKENQLSSLSKVLFALGEKTFEEYQRTYESVKEYITLQEMSFIQLEKNT